MSDPNELLTVPRELFVPPVVWVDDPATDGFVSVSRTEDEPRWRALVETDGPVVTQVDDGRTPPGEVGLHPSSSCSQPYLVAAMLDALDVRPGDHVLEIGTGTGWNAALLSELVGEHGHVVSVEVDADLAEQARRRLTRAGHTPLVVTADGTEGHPPHAPYDRVICTASIREIPRTWIEQTRSGGVIVTPWGTDYGDDALTRWEVHEDGSASGHCGTSLAFMRLRNQRRNFLVPTEQQINEAETSTTRRGGRELYEMVTFCQASFTIGLRVPNCYLTVDDLDQDHRAVELHDPRSTSWARASLVRGEHPWTVHQLGPRRLWDEVEAAHHWWSEVGKPPPRQYRLTVSPDGTHTVRLHTPHGEHRWAVTP
ncbi:methyltransferase domain-containing protein [Actinopolyspora mortivallis]|uniref:Protein-L-isoaspartate O-methyltransferase n=1 Tax=Actinopolyspora mortivallis TaxID=33906 RepID=A0A2T0GXU0_ACTMO|nr:methyltransferase domain-containing protein [Actinopolyspora mortivallis]PRW63914.1 protein-L-isoaspartate(D-aspartate) O-methyltransferase [Actinopolyspora mortivallis]